MPDVAGKSVTERSALVVTVLRVPADGVSGKYFKDEFALKHHHNRRLQSADHNLEQNTFDGSSGQIGTLPAMAAVLQQIND